MPNIETFARQYGPAAMQAGQALGVDPSILLGQWGLETGWGKSVIPGTNNLGNIKDFSGGGVAATDNATGSRDNYRAYDTPAGFADDYVSLIQRMYPGAVGAGNDAMGFANALKSGGYAEDPAYVQKVTGTTGMVRKLGERLTDMLIPSASAAELPPGPSQAEAQPQSVGTPSTDASQPADGPSGFQGKIQQALEAGYSPDEVKQYLLGREDFAGKLEQARQAGYSDDEIWQYLGFGDKPKAGQPGEPYRVKITLHEGEQPATGQASHGGIVGGIQQGLRDPIDAGAQMLRRIVPDSVGNAVDALGNKLAELGLPIAPSTGVAGVDSLVNRSNAQYEADRAAAGRSGIDFARIGGDLLGTAPMLGGGLLARGATLPARVGIGAAQGGAAGLLSPVVGADNQARFGDVKGQQGLLSAAFGGAMAPVASGVGRVLSPRASQPGSAARLLQKEGVELTPGQAAGGWLLATEDKLMSTPLLGDAIRASRRRGNEQFNRAVYNRVLEPIGGKTSKTGRAAVDDVSGQVSKAYDDLLAKVEFRPDAKFEKDINQLWDMVVDGLPEKEARSFLNTMQREVLEPISQGQAVPGVTFKKMEAQLGSQAQKFHSSTDAYQRQAGDAIQQLQALLREGLARSNPDHAAQLSKVNEAYARLTRLQEAAGGIGATEGVFTPAQFSSAVRKGDRTVRKNQFARGGALMQDLADAGRNRMMSTIPNSGTTDRALLGALGYGLGAGAINPGLLAAPAAASAAYLPGVTGLLSRGLFTARPQLAHQAAPLLQKAPVGLLGAQFGAH